MIKISNRRDRPLALDLALHYLLALNLRDYRARRNIRDISKGCFARREEPQPRYNITTLTAYIHGFPWFVTVKGDHSLTGVLRITIDFRGALLGATTVQTPQTQGCSTYNRRRVSTTL